MKKIPIILFIVLIVQIQAFDFPWHKKHEDNSDSSQEGEVDHFCSELTQIVDDVCIIENRVIRFQSNTTYNAKHSLQMKNV